MNDEGITIASERQIAQVEMSPNQSTAAYKDYIFLPLLFMTVALLGGLRIGLANSEFLFVRPALVCLVFAAILMVLFVRARLIDFDGWFSESFTALENIASATVLLSLYAAAVQVFNSLLPEAGIPFWIVAFCFLWTLWNNLFARFNAKHLLQSLGGLFLFAFVAKYMILLNFSTQSSQSWWDFLSSGNITKEVISSLLAVPPYAGSTGYIQFFALALFLIGLFFVRPRIR